MAVLLELFLTFFKIGLFTFGGGYAMISVIESICVEKKNWITHDDMMNVVVIAESTPGPIAINCATFVGYKRRGLPGAIASTLGVVLPSFVIIYIISMFLDHFLDYTVVANAFKGIQAAVCLLVIKAGVTMLKKMKKEPLAVGIFACACAAMLAISIFSWHFSSILLMLIAAVVSLAAFAISEAKKGGADR